jgi:hypothetical protein
VSKIHRLSIYNISDVLARGRLVREIQKAPLNWRRWEVTEGQAMRPDIIAYQVYGSVVAVPIILAAAKVDNPDKPLPIGELIALPDASWLRLRILHYSKAGN